MCTFFFFFGVGVDYLGFCHADTSGQRRASPAPPGTGTPAGTQRDPVGSSWSWWWGVIKEEGLPSLGSRQEVVAASEGDARSLSWGSGRSRACRAREAEGGHDRSAAVLHLHAERVARLDGLVQVVEADREQKSEHRNFLVSGWHCFMTSGIPGARLLQHLLHGLVAQQVGQPASVLVLYAIAGWPGWACSCCACREIGLAEEEPARRAQAAVRARTISSREPGPCGIVGARPPGGGGSQAGEAAAVGGRSSSRVRSQRWRGSGAWKSAPRRRARGGTARARFCAGLRAESPRAAPGGLRPGGAE